MLDPFSERKSIEVVFPFFLHLWEHFKIKFASDNTMIETEYSQSVE
jgi:hypothetical protein